MDGDGVASSIMLAAVGCDHPHGWQDHQDQVGDIDLAIEVDIEPQGSDQ